MTWWYCLFRDLIMDTRDNYYYLTYIIADTVSGALKIVTLRQISEYSCVFCSQFLKIYQKS